MFIHTYQEFRDQVWEVAAFNAHNLDNEIRQWCLDVYGPDSSKRGRWRDNIGYGEVRFANKQDLAWFILRWS